MPDQYGNVPFGTPENTIPDQPLRPDIEAAVKQMVATQLETERARHDEEMAKLKAELESAKSEVVIAKGAAPMTLVPEHAGGPGTEVAPTWSLAEQEAMRD